MTPSGIEIFELRRNRMRLLRKLSRGDIFSADFEMSSYVGIVALVGRRCFRPCMKSMVKDQSPEVEIGSPVGEW